MTTKAIDWLNNNRFKAYPFVNDDGILVNGTRIPDFVLLDCRVVDTRRGIGIPSLTVTKYSILQDRTVVYFTYDGISSSCTIQESSDGNPFIRLRATFTPQVDTQFFQIDFIFSTHSVIREQANDLFGTGNVNLEFDGHILPSKVVSVQASGVSGIKANGSYGIYEGGTVTGTVRLIDGCRTRPTIQNGKIVVRVGQKYGEDPCRYRFFSEEEPEAGDVCKDLLLFFCGQNAITSGNIVLSGGPGVSVYQGGTYTAKYDINDSFGKIGIHEGESIPCIEIKATSELLNIYRPSSYSSSSSGSDS